MNIQKFVNSLNSEELQLLKQILDVDRQKQKEEKEKKQKEWEENEKPKIISQINELTNDLNDLKSCEIQTDLKLTLTVKPFLRKGTKQSKSSILDNVQNGYGLEVDYEVCGKVSSLDGKRNKTISFINANLESFLDDACDEILKLFPEFESQKEKIETKADKITESISFATRQGFNTRT